MLIGEIGIKGDVRRMIEDIVKAYNKYQSKVKNAPQDFIDCVLVLNPESYMILIQECRDKMFFNLYTDVERLEIFGEDVPIIVDEQLSENVKFLIISRAEYERQEQEKLYKRIEEMFRRTEDGIR